MLIADLTAMTILTVLILTTGTIQGSMERTVEKKIRDLNVITVNKEQLNQGLLHNHGGQ